MKHLLLQKDPEIDDPINDDLYLLEEDKKDLLEDLKH